MTIEAIITEQILAVCPIDGIAFGTIEEKASWRVDFRPEATQEQQDAAAGVMASFDVAAAESAQQADTDAMDALQSEARTDAVFTALKSATGAQIATFIDNTFPAMTVQERRVIRLLLHVAALTLRRG